MSESCPTCAVLQDEVRWLRDELRALRLPGAQAPAAAPLGGTPGVATVTTPEELVTAAGVFVNPQGIAMVVVDGEAVPLTEYQRGRRAIEQAMAGKPIVTEDV